MKNNLKWPITVQDKKLIMEFDNEVFIPSLTSFFVAWNMKINPGEIVFDVGTGSGFFAILASMFGAKKVYATENEVDAYNLAKRNLKLNNIKNIDLIKAEYFGSNNTIKCDLIVANLPQFPIPVKEKNNPIWKLVDGGEEDGNFAVINYLKFCKNHLKPTGRIYFPLVYISHPKKTLEVMNDLYISKLIATQEIPFSHYNYASFDWLITLQKQKKAEFFQKDGVWYFKEEFYELSNRV